MQERLYRTLRAGPCVNQFHANPDLFARMRAAMPEHGTKRDALAALEQHTIGAASEICEGPEFGSITVGSMADLTIVRTGRKRFHSVARPVLHLLTSASGDDVRSVIVDGRVLMRNRRHFLGDERGTAENLAFIYQNHIADLVVGSQVEPRSHELQSVAG